MSRLCDLCGTSEATFTIGAVINHFVDGHPPIQPPLDAKVWFLCEPCTDQPLSFRLNPKKKLPPKRRKALHAKR